MPTLEERLRLAASLGPRAGVAALSAALVAAHETERPAITRMLLAAAHAGPDDPGLRALVREWALLDHEGRLGVMRLFEAAPAGALRQLLAKTDAEDQRAAALVAVVFVQDRAGARSFGAGVRWAGRDAVGERALMRAADGALAHAAGEYPGHRLPGLIESIACMAAHPGPALARWLDDREQAGHLALRAAVKALPMDHLARAGVAMLRFQCIARTVTDMLVHPGTPELRSRILESSVLMRVHGRRARARVTPEQVARLIGPAERFASLPEAARRGAIGWISSIASTGSGMKVLDLLTPRLADPAASVRFDAVAAIESMPASPTGDALLTDFAFDADERVASRAVSALVSARSASRRAAVRQKLESLRRSPHRRVRSLVLDMESLIDPWAVTNGEPWRCAAAAREELVRDKSAFCDELRRRVGCGEPAQRLAAMRLAERLNTAEDIEHELVVASRDSDARVASKAVQLLGRVPTEPARRAVREALANPEMRVRANALEIAPPALLDTEGVRRFMEDEAPRIRANAVRRALSARPDDARASRVLVDMLGDARPGHRASGLWVTERLARRGVPIMEALSERVDALARAEREPLVAARAARCARRLFAEMRLGWARPPVRGVAAERGVQWDRVEEGAPPARSAAA